MVGGEAEASERLRPLFSVMGKTITYLGPAGSGQHTKMVNQVPRLFPETFTLA
jgi:3-hydroxyisobutyrate dehydrogenase